VLAARKTVFKPRVQPERERWPEQSERTSSTDQRQTDAPRHCACKKKKRTRSAAHCPGQHTRRNCRSSAALRVSCRGRVPPGPPVKRCSLSAWAAPRESVASLPMRSLDPQRPRWDSWSVHRGRAVARIPRFALLAVSRRRAAQSARSLSLASPPRSVARFTARVGIARTQHPASPRGPRGQFAAWQIGAGAGRANCRL